MKEEVVVYNGQNCLEIALNPQSPLMHTPTAATHDLALQIVKRSIEGYIIERKIR